MKSFANNTALLLFSRSAQADAQVKQLAATSRRSYLVAKLLDRHSRRLATQSGLPIFVVDETMQYGEGFGSRFQHAIAYVFAQGFNKVIAIGNDCPNLSLDLLRRANQELHQHDLILGPSSDGGVYLLGLNQKAFQSLAFDQLPWQTDQLFQALSQTRDMLRLSNNYPIIDDIDSYQDLLLLLSQKTLPNWLQKPVLDILRLRSFPIHFTLSKYILFRPSFFSLRAPPFLRFR